MCNDTRVAIFVDAENLTQWLKQNGVEGFLEELSSLGTVVVRKAYARWTSAPLTHIECLIFVRNRRYLFNLILINIFIRQDVGKAKWVCQACLPIGSKKRNYVTIRPKSRLVVEVLSAA